MIERTEDGWRVRDDHSRNGTYVNDQKIDDAVLRDGHVIRVGGVEMAFHQSTEPPTAGTGHGDAGATQTIIRDAPVVGGDTGSLALGALKDSDQAKDLLLLYQLSIKLVGCTQASEVIRASLDLLRERLSASVVGFLWVNDEGRLEPKLVVPERSNEPVRLSESLTRLVAEEGRAIWIANQRAAGEDDSVDHYADGLCVPLLAGGRVLGAVHVYLERGRFRQSHFDFAISVANITAVALARAREDETLKSDVERLRNAAGVHDDLVGECPAMLELKAKISRLGKASGSVLVRGESGAGKELVASALHKSSPRADRPMLAVNCAAIPDDLMESQLFGHKAGAFTGADRDHQGFFQQADLGTLFLDEVGELTLQGQAKLLRVLEGHPFLPVGSTNEVSVDVRVIAATNQDLQTYVREKKFREDLYYRLSVFELRIPPLRERGDDIARLIDFFLAHFRRQHGRPDLTMSDAARGKLLDYAWPGNVRQLRNVIDSAVVLAERQIEPVDLGLRDVSGDVFDSLRIEDWEKRLIVEALQRTRGSVPEAAKLLGIGRATLYRKIDEYGIPRD
ncbi:MAG: sigma 54-interacting transcriptional regulator [Pirellulales bacterium]